MIMQPGPILKNRFKELIVSKLNKFRGIFFVLILLLPLAIYFPFKFNWFSSGPIISQNILEGVARVNGEEGTGSAFLVSSTKLITARHVVEGVPDGGAVTLDFLKSKGNINGVLARVLFLPSNPDNDYAVLELISPLNNVPTLSMGNSDNASINDIVTVIGYPGGLFSSTKGTISNNEIPENNNLMQLNAGAWPGNSGGPVLNESDEVIGILIAGAENEYKGITFAIKIDALLNDPEFKKKGIKL